ncbi:MAG TPA: hypothetical protein VMM76_04095, partial [Pirellulaceae bacterium]|nr:hypothetical protein [Pirellulaceae bacterium]
MPLKSNTKTTRSLQFGIRTFLVGVGVVSVFFAVANAILVPWYFDRGKIAMLNEVNAQVFTEPRGQYLFRQFFGNTF